MSIIETKKLTKQFGTFYANKDIDLSVEEGEIRAIIGENGAGKTTLMNMLYGIIKPTSGQLYWKGKEVNLTSPKDAIKLGIGMVHQHFKLVSSMTVYENILLGEEINRERTLFGKKVKSPFLDIDREKREVQELIDRLDFQLNVNDKVADLSVGACQRVEILKMLYRNIDVLILDEPTAVLIPQEIDALMETLRKLKQENKTIIIITHKLAEVKQCADSISVIRAGQVICTVKNDDAATQEFLAEKMVGHKVSLAARRSPKPVGENVLYSVKDLTGLNKYGQKVVDHVSFEIHENEIVGIAGVEGNGQSELVLMLSGLMECESGAVKLKGQDITGCWPDTIRAMGIGIIPEDRYAQGLCAPMSVSRNLIAGYHGLKKFCRHGFMNKKAIRENKEKLCREYDIRLSAGDPQVAALSGGNAQKIIIARELDQNPMMLLACQPTRGVDIGATEFVHENIIRTRDEGKAVLLISSDLGEIMNLSDRILVMYKGEIVGEFDARTTERMELGLYMSGAKRQTPMVVDGGEK